MATSKERSRGAKKKAVSQDERERLEADERDAFRRRGTDTSGSPADRESCSGGGLEAETGQRL
jgi:hypothetical protein